MDFNLRGDDLKTPSCQFPSPMQTHFSDPSLLRGGFPSIVTVPDAEQMLNPNVASEDMLRRLDKERIRREIISGEIVRRRMLEEEVRRELMLERELAFRRGLGEKFLLDGQVAIGMNPSFDNRPLQERIRRQTMSSVEPADPMINMDKLIMLARPNPDVYREKRKAVTQCAHADDDDTEHSPVVVKKKPKDNWSCALCSVSVTSEKSLIEHFEGRKHKARESAQKRIQKIGMSTSASPSYPSKNSEQSLKKLTETITTTTTSDLEAKVDAQAQPDATWADTDQPVVGKYLVVEVKTKDEEIVEKIQNTDDPEKQNVTETEKVIKPNASQPEVTEVDTNQTVEVGKDPVVEVKAKNEEIVVDKIQGTEDSEKLNVTETEQHVTMPNAVNDGFKFWCELCNVGSFSMVGMENHRLGRKHNNRLKISRQNNNECRSS